MPEITFVFGPANSFFFDCPKTWKFDRLPETLHQLFRSSMGPAWRIVQPYNVALAPQVNSPEPLWYVGCKVMSGEDKIFHSQTYFEANYADLSRWTKSIPNAPMACYVTFGQNSYFASAPGHGSIWAGIPSELEDKVRKAFDTPCCVSLGANNAWFVLWPDGYFSWKFYGNYSALDRILTAATPRSVSYLAISPYNKEHYFVAFRDRSIQYNFTGAPPEWMRLMREVFDAWTAERTQPQQPLTPTPNALYSQVQAYQQQPASCYYSNTTVESPCSPTTPLAPPTPVTPNTPLSEHASLGLPNSQRNSMYAHKQSSAYVQPPIAAIELPVELPGDTLLAAPAPVPVTSAPSEKRRKFFSRIF